jgi:hypothetical protein
MCEKPITIWYAIHSVIQRVPVMPYIAALQCTNACSGPSEYFSERNLCSTSNNAKYLYSNVRNRSATTRQCSVHPSIYTYIHTYIHTCIHAYMHTSIHNACIRPSIHIHPSIHPLIHPQNTSHGSTTDTHPPTQMQTRTTFNLPFHLHGSSDNESLAAVLDVISNHHGEGLRSGGSAHVFSDVATNPDRDLSPMSVLAPPAHSFQNQIKSNQINNQQNRLVHKAPPKTHFACQPASQSVSQSAI